METNEHSITEEVDADTDLCRLCARQSIYQHQQATLREVPAVALQPLFFVFRL